MKCTIIIIPQTINGNMKNGYPAPLNAHINIIKAFITKYAMGIIYLTRIRFHGIILL